MILCSLRRGSGNGYVHQTTAHSGRVWQQSCQDGGVMCTHIWRLSLEWRNVSPYGRNNKGGAVAVGVPHRPEEGSVERRSEAVSARKAEYRTLGRRIQKRRRAGARTQINTAEDESEGNRD